MLSTCPHCLNQINHLDKITEVKCTDCGTVFPAFHRVSLEDSTGEHSNPGDSPSFNPSHNAVELGDSLSPLAAATPADSDFTESTAAFADIRGFGETLSEDPTKTKRAPTASAVSHNEAQPVPAPVLKNSSGTWLMTSGDLLQNQTIQEYLSPVSVLSELVPGDNPMQPAFAALREQASKLGGNAVVAMRWSLSGDATKVLVSGTAVKCAKS